MKCSAESSGARLLPVLPVRFAPPLSGSPQFACGARRWRRRETCGPDMEPGRRGFSIAAHSGTCFSCKCRERAGGPRKSGRTSRAGRPRRHGRPARLHACEYRGGAVSGSLQCSGLMTPGRRRSAGRSRGGRIRICGASADGPVAGNPDAAFRNRRT